MILFNGFPCKPLVSDFSQSSKNSKYLVTLYSCTDGSQRAISVSERVDVAASAVMLNVLSTQMMFNRTVNFAYLLILLFAICRGAVASCSDGYYLNNGNCVECTLCAPGEILEQCSNTSDTVCSRRTSCGELQYLQNGSCKNCTVCNIVETPCSNTSDTVCSRCRDFEIPNAGGGCDFNCDKCRPNGMCVDRRRCDCDSGYEGLVCDIRKPITTDPSTSTVPRSTPDPEGDGNRVVLTVSIVLASVLAVVVAITIIIIYYKCSKRSAQDSENNSDDSTYSSASINSRTMLTNAERGSNASLQHHHKQMSNGFKSSILPPPESWNNSIASAIK